MLRQIRTTIFAWIAVAAAFAAAAVFPFAAAQLTGNNACDANGLCRADYPCDPQSASSPCTPASEFRASMHLSPSVAGTLASNIVQVESFYSSTPLSFPSASNGTLLRNLTAPVPWFWTHGPNAANKPGINDAEPHIRSSTVTPTSRTTAVSWLDPLTSDLFLFGGSDSGGTWLSDLHRFHRDANEWELMQEPRARNLGTRLEPSAATYPGPREQSCAASDPISGLAFVHGGSAATDLGDLYSYNSTSNQFAYLGGPTGSAAAAAATVGQSFAGSSASNFAGARYSHACWVSAGYFVIAGGRINTDYRQDVWSYHIASDTWHFIAGFNGADAAASAFAAANTQPMAFGEAVSAGPWFDEFNPTALHPLYLMLGFGKDQASTLDLSDALWRMDFTPGTPPTAQWTLLAGSATTLTTTATTLQNGVRGVAAPTNLPSSRVGAQLILDASQAGQGRTLVLFGGASRMAPSGTLGITNDLWLFDTVDGLWVWVDGDPTSDAAPASWPSSYSRSPLTSSPARRQNGNLWCDRTGALWLGMGFDGTGLYFSDLWRTAPLGTLEVTVTPQPSLLSTAPVLSALATNEAWYWQAGQANLDYAGNNYATATGPSASVQPPSLQETEAWVDRTTGDIYMYGGMTGTAFTSSRESTLYRFDPATSLWEVKRAAGAANQGATRRVPDANVHPGPRSWACSAVDPVTGIAYVFGGSTDGLSDIRSGELYSYDSATNQFTYHTGPNNSELPDASAVVGDSQAGSTLGDFGGARWGQSCWLSGGHFIVAGGNTASGRRQDIWSYDITNDKWWFALGLQNFGAALAAPAVAAGQPVAFILAATAGPFFDAANPTARHSMFMFGGQFDDINADDDYMDTLWRLDFFPGATPGTAPKAVWTLLTGNGQICNLNPTMAQYARPASSATHPPSRGSAAMAVDPSDGRTLILFGGDAYFPGGVWGESSELWTFDTESELWTFVSGTTTSVFDGVGAFVYPGGYGQDSATSHPFRRQAHQLLIGPASTVWVLGGIYWANTLAGRLYSDLWRMGPTLVDSQSMCTPGSSANTVVTAYPSIATLSASTPWLWLNGQPALDYVGSNFGTVGFRDPSVQPPAVHGAFHWIDPVSGDPFRYGGHIPVIAGGLATSELYRFYRSSNEWKLMRTPTSRNLGATRRIEDPTAHLGSRAFGCVAVDPVTKLVFFFGGSDDSTRFGDIWSYNSVTNLFAYHSGPASAMFDGSVLVGQSSDGSTFGNYAGSKNEAACWYANGYLIVAGGYAADGTATQDVWAYDVANDRWWFTIGLRGGSQGATASLAIAATPPQPLPWGGAGYAGPFYDASNPTANNPMYLQGGWVHDPTTQYYGDALWRLDFTPGADAVTAPTAVWTLLFGSRTTAITGPTVAQVAQYGTPGVASPTNWPTARYSTSMAMDPTAAGAGRYIVLFGGDGFAPPSLDWTLDDLWRFDTVTGEWTFISGHISGELTDSAWPVTYLAESATARPSKRSLHTLLIDFDSQVWILNGQNLQNSDSKQLYSDVWRTGPVTVEKPCSPIIVSGTASVPLLETDKPLILRTHSASQSLSLNLRAHKLSDSSGSGAETPAETEEAFVTIPLTSASDPDPCSTGANPCLNGAGCTSRVVAVGLGWEAQIRCLCPDGFFTATCAVGIVECAQCVASYVGGSTVRLRAVGLDATVRRLRLAEIPIAAFNTTSGATGQVRTITSRSLLATTGGIDELTFIAPTIPLRDNSTVNPVTGIRYSAYQTLEVTLALNVSGSSTLRLFAYNLTGYIFATASSCVNEGEWKPTPSGGCEACPRGAYCPGASRAWPLDDYWSINEWLAPRHCPLRQTCVATKRIGSMQSVIGPDGQPALVKKTDNCERGYTDLECVRCADDHYQLDSRCYPCPSLETQKLQLALVLFAAGVVVLMLSLAISFLSGNTLSVLTMLFVLFQRVTALGSAGSRELLKNAKEVATLFSLLNVVNFNVEIVNPGCAVRALNWIGLFWATMLIVAITYVCFMAAAFLRYRINLSRQAKQAGQIGVNAVSPAEDFRRRRIHVTIIAGSLFYLKVVSLQVSGFLCATAPSRDSRAWIGPQAEGMEPQTSNFVRVDWETVCWDQQHAGTMAFILFSLLTFTVGFPVWITLTLRRSFSKSKVAPIEAGGTSDSVSKSDSAADARALAQTRLDTYGVMFRGLRPSLWWFKVTQFPVSVWFAICVGVLRSDVPLQLFLLGLSASLQSALAITLMPFVRRRANALLVSTAMGTLAYVILLMLIQPGSVPVTIYILIALFVGCAVGLIVRIIKGIRQGVESAAMGGEQEQQGQSSLKQITVGSSGDDTASGSTHKSAPKRAFVEMTPLASPSAAKPSKAVSATASTAVSPTAVSPAAPSRSPAADREAGEGHIWGLKPAEEQHGHVWGVKSTEAGAVKRTQTHAPPKALTPPQASDSSNSSPPPAAVTPPFPVDTLVEEDVE